MPVGWLNKVNQSRMNKVWTLLIILLGAFSLLADAQQDQTGENVEVRSGIDHRDYDRLLKKYVDERGLVNYSGWKQNQADRRALDDYLKQFASKIDNPARGNEKAASLVNAYNAFMLHWILMNYPTESVWSLKDSFTAKRINIGGHNVSFNDIENGALRPLLGYRAHSVLVCAARSCPPLQRSAYSEDKFDEQDDHAFHAWLARDDLNRFLPNETKVEISSIFKWFKGDFDNAGGASTILGRYAPQTARDFAASGKYDVKYISYNWGLNDQGPHGRNYGKANLIFDNVFK
jgi:hypothetical protein